MNKFLKFIILTIPVLLLIGGGFWLWRNDFFSDPLAFFQGPANAQQEIDKIVKQVSKLIDLPQDEQPTVATVSDKEKLKDQNFFAKAENGDKVLIYPQARKAYLFRPTTKKLIEVAPLNIEDAAQPAQVVETPTQGQVAGESTETVQTEPLRVALYNGTTIAGLTTRFETELSTSGVVTTVVAKQNAAKQDYTESVIVDLTGDNTELVDTLSEKLSIPAGSLPAGEARPPADVLIILGSDTQ
jgi:hypothetical protein